MNDLSIFDQLADYICIRSHACAQVIKDRDWDETKMPPKYDLWYVISGTIRYEYNGRTERLSEGDCVLMYPDMLYHACADGGPCCFLYLHFDLTIGNGHPLLEQYQLAGIVRKNIIKADISLLEPFLDLTDTDHGLSDKKFYLNAFVLSFLSKLFLLCQTGEYLGFDRAGAEKPKQNSALHSGNFQNVLTYIDEHIGEALPIDTLASIAAMSPKYFITAFKKAFGITPKAYVADKKLSLGMQYLIMGDLQVKEIAELLGYTDLYAFSNAFHRKYGNAPTFYRKPH